MTMNATHALALAFVLCVGCASENGHLTCESEATSRPPSAVPARVEALTKMFMAWTLDGTPIPARAGAIIPKYGDLRWLEHGLAKLDAKHVVVSWSVRAASGTSSSLWKYVLSDGTVLPLNHDERRARSAKRDAGTLDVRETASIHVRETPSGELRITFWIGLAGALLTLQENPSGYELVGKMITVIQ